MCNQTAVVLLVGVVGATIAYMQWRTAHQKVLLDLFEKRLKIYEDVNNAILDFLSSDGNLVPSQMRIRLHQANLSSQFLFGSEVAARIVALSEDVRQLGDLRRKIRNQAHSDQELETLAKLLSDRENELERWRDVWTPVCAPYLRMDQKRVRTPWEWLHELARSS